MKLDPTKYDAIFFDAINTLFDVSSRPKSELAEYVRQFSADPWEPVTVPDEWLALPAFDDAHEAVGRMQRFHLAILSNVPAWAVRCMRTSNEIGRISVVDLEESRIYKPDPRAYVWAAGYMQLDPSRCLMVSANARIGHSGESDVSAAAKVGMPGILIRQKHDDGTPVEGSPQSLIELAEWLGC